MNMWVEGEGFVLRGSFGVVIVFFVGVSVGFWERLVGVGC